MQKKNNHLIRYLVFLVIIFGFIKLYQTQLVKKSKILYSTENSNNLFIMNADGSEKAILFKTDFKPQWFSWSNDGNEIILNTYDKKEAGVYVINIHDKIIKKNNVSKEADLPCWSKDGKYMAFMIEDKPGITITTKEGKILRTVAGRGINGAYQSWSPKFDQLVFESGRDGNPEIYTINPLNGKELKRLTENELLDEWPSFSKDGLLIAWVRGVEGDKNIWVMNKDGSDQRQVTHSIKIGDGFPSFSPDGSELCFPSLSENEVASIHITNIDGSNIRKVGEGYFPNWSPYLQNI